MSAAAAAAAFASRLDGASPSEDAASGLDPLRLELTEFTLTGAIDVDTPALAGGCMEGGRRRDNAALPAGRDVGGAWGFPSREEEEEGDGV